RGRSPRAKPRTATAGRSSLVSLQACLHLVDLDIQAREGLVALGGQPRPPYSYSLRLNFLMSSSTFLRLWGRLLLSLYSMRSASRLSGSLVSRWTAMSAV